MCLETASGLKGLLQREASWVKFTIYAACFCVQSEETEELLVVLSSDKRELTRNKGAYCTKTH